jgi:hypothetical protein
MLSIPTEYAGIPVWLILFVVAGFLFFFLKISGDDLNQDKFPTLRLFVFIAAIFISIAGVAGFVQWAKFW